MTGRLLDYKRNKPQIKLRLVNETTVKFSSKNKLENIPVYDEGEVVVGDLIINGVQKHCGIQAEIIGSLEFAKETRGNRQVYYQRWMISEATKSVASIKYLVESEALSDVQDSYAGQAWRIRYYLKIKVMISERKSIDKSISIWVKRQNIMNIEPKSSCINVGIVDSIDLDFVISKNIFKRDEFVVGEVGINLCRIKLDYIEICIVKREIAFGEISDEILGKTEIVDGAVIRGEVIPFRFLLDNWSLGPTMKVDGGAVDWIFRLVVVDNCGRKYFKDLVVMLY